MNIKKIDVISAPNKNTIAYLANESFSTPVEDYNGIKNSVSYLIKKDHWSPLECANIVFELTVKKENLWVIMKHRSLVVLLLNNDSHCEGDDVQRIALSGNIRDLINFYKAKRNHACEEIAEIATGIEEAMKYIIED